MSADQPSTHSERRSASFGDWETGSILALCDDDHCPWKHRGVTLLATDEAAAEHARKRAHSVTIIMESKRTVAP